MRVVIIAERFPDADVLLPNGGGGSELSAYFLGKNLSERGISVTVVTNRTPTNKVCSVSGNLKVLRIPFLSQRFNGKYPFSDELRYTMQRFDVSKILKVITDAKPDIIHVEHRAVGFLQIKNILKIPVALFVRDYWPFCISGEFFNGKHLCFNCSPKNASKCAFANGTYLLDIRRVHEIMFNLVLLSPRVFLSKSILSSKQKMLKLSDGILANSQYMKKMVKTYLDVDEDKISVVYPPLTSFEYVEPFANVSEKKTFTYIGWLTHGKGIVNLLTAFHKAVRQNHQIHLRIFGLGNMQRYIETYIAGNSLNHNISYEGFLPHSKFCQVMSDTDVVIVPSLWPEPFGRVNCEAMLCGRPVIINPVGGLTEQIEDGSTGFYVDCYSIDALSCKILEVARMPREELIAMGKRARNFVLDKFDNKTQIKALLTAYEQILR